MNDQEWGCCQDPQRVLEFLRARGPVSERKGRLCAVAWARSFLDCAPAAPRAQPYLRSLAGPQWLPQLAAAERYADGQADRKALRASRQGTGGPYNLYRVVAGASRYSFDAACRAFGYALQEFRTPPGGQVCGIARCVFGPLPFHEARIHPAWLVWQGGTIPKLAASAYEERRLPRGHLDAARLGILADALEEAGCTDQAVLDHLRGPGPHVRGCWPVDLILGRG